MNDVINVVDEYGNAFEVEVLDIFEVEGYDHEYIMYTRNQEVDEDNIETYVSILQSENDNYSLVNIEDESNQIYTVRCFGACRSICMYGL